MTTTRYLRPERDSLSGNYGPHFRRGIVADHLHIAEQGGAVVRPSSTGSGVEWVVWPDGEADPVLCGDIIRMPMTEDGYRPDGRCGDLATRDGMCEGHAAEMNGWRAMSEVERAAWERRNDEDSYFG